MDSPYWAPEVLNFRLYIVDYIGSRRNKTSIEAC